MPETTKTDPQTEMNLPPADAGAPSDELNAARAELTALKQKASEYERLLTSPEYIQYMASQSRAAASPKSEADETDFDAMSNKDLAAWLSKKTSAEIAKAVGAVQETVMQIEVRRQVDVAKAAHSDFETYRPRMIELSKQHPSLTVEEAYKFAKAEGSAPKAAEAVPKPKGVTKTEAPSNTGRLEKPVKGFDQAYNKAWDEVVGAGKTTT